jgi:hypothetical protein
MISMRDFEGELLIGGMTLKQLHVELTEGQPHDNSHDYLLCGRLTLAAQEHELLQIGRRYRLQLNDGRAGQVVIESMNRYGHSVVAEFRPQQRAAVAVGQSVSRKENPARASAVA